jgi:hypothetical protein
MKDLPRTTVAAQRKGWESQVGNRGLDFDVFHSSADRLQSLFHYVPGEPSDQPMKRISPISRISRIGRITRRSDARCRLRAYSPSPS